MQAGIQNSALSRYSSGAIVLHWAIAALIVGNIVLAEMAEDLARAAKPLYMDPHKAIGIMVLVLTLVRIGWRLKFAAPPLVDGLRNWERFMARAIHGLFYVLMVALPLSGWLMVSAPAEPKVIDFFGLFDISPLPVAGNKIIGGAAHEGHEVMGKVMIVLIALHVLGALKHQFLDRVPSLRRMWFS